MVTIASAEWAYVGQDSYRLAKYWVRRYAHVGGASASDNDESTGALRRSGGHNARRVDPDWAADAVAVAYERYCTWRADHKPDDPVKVIQSFIRTAAREAVRTSCRSADRKPAETGRTAELFGVEVSVAPDVDRVVRVIRRLPERLQEIALRIACSVAVPSTRELADQLDMPQTTVSHRIRQLRKSPAVWDLLLAHVGESATASV